MIVRKSSARKTRAGFTLMEMMIVIAIIVALAGLGIFYMSGQADEAYIARAKADLASLNQAAVAYRLKHPQRQYPASLDDIVNAGLVKSVTDPWGGVYKFESQGVALPPKIYALPPGSSTPIFPD
jgi:general secretion pathway protein G